PDREVQVDVGHLVHDRERRDQAEDQPPQDGRHRWAEPRLPTLGCHLAGVGLVGLDLVGLDLVGLDLAGVQLARAVGHVRLLGHGVTCWTSISPTPTLASTTSPGAPVPTVTVRLMPRPPRSPLSSLPENAPPSPRSSSLIAISLPMGAGNEPADVAVCTRTVIPCGTSTVSWPTPTETSTCLGDTGFSVAGSRLDRSRVPWPTPRAYPLVARAT